jgi:hypothetical protein
METERNIPDDGAQQIVPEANREAAEARIAELKAKPEADLTDEERQEIEMWESALK